MNCLIITWNRGSPSSNQELLEASIWYFQHLILFLCNSVENHWRFLCHSLYFTNTHVVFGDFFCLLLSHRWVILGKQKMSLLVLCNSLTVFWILPRHCVSGILGPDSCSECGNHAHLEISSRTILLAWFLCSGLFVVPAEALPKLHHKITITQIDKGIL